MAWKSRIVGYMIGDAAPTRMTFWVGVAGSYKKNRLPETVPVEPECAYVEVRRKDGAGIPIRTDFDLAALVRCGTGAHKNLAYEGWKAKIEGLAEGTEYVYSIVISGTKSGAKFGMTDCFHVSNVAFRSPTLGPAPFRAVFSSCQRAKYHKSSGVDTTQPAWAMVPCDVDVNLLLGDTHYANSHTRWMKWLYSQAQLGIANYQKVIASVPTYAIYDDHDFIDNNLGGDTGYGKHTTKYGPRRERASRYFDGLWMIPPTPVRDRSHGCFHSFTYQGVLFVMLDTVYYRCQASNQSPSGNLLGNLQWKWLAKVLGKATESTIKVICSGCTLTSSGSGWEWQAFPAAESRLRSTLSASPGGLRNTLFVSGDIHKVLYRPADPSAAVPIPELISSGIGIKGDAETRGFAIVDFDPGAVTADYSLYNWNTDKTAPYATDRVQWSTA